MPLRLKILMVFMVVFMSTELAWILRSHFDPLVRVFLWIVLGCMVLLFVALLVGHETTGYVVLIGAWLGAILSGISAITPIPFVLLIHIIDNQEPLRPILRVSAVLGLNAAMYVYMIRRSDRRWRLGGTRLTGSGRARHAFRVKRLSLLLAFVVLALVAVPKPADASVMLALDFPALVAQADHVVVGDVESSTSRWDGAGKIVTDVSIRVDETMMGNRASGETLVVTHLGGAVGGVGLHIEGEARFAVGERVLVFGANVRGSNTLVRVVGMSQGAFEIRTMPEHPGDEMVMPSGAGLALMQRVRNSRLLPAPPALLEPRSLSSLRPMLRELIGARGAR